MFYSRVIVKRKLNKGPKLAELEDRAEDKREGRHLLFMQGFSLSPANHIQLTIPSQIFSCSSNALPTVVVHSQVEQNSAVSTMSTWPVALIGTNMQRWTTGGQCEYYSLSNVFFYVVILFPSRFGVPPGYRPPTSVPSYNEHHQHHEHTEHHEYYEHSHQVTRSFLFSYSSVRVEVTNIITTTRMTDQATQQHLW